jgi:branched-chain amino acid transport system substrate-binding protein
MLEAKRIDPGGYTLYSYAAVQIIQQAAETARSLDPKRVAAVIRSGRTFQTVIGPLSFNAQGDRADADFVIHVWRKAADGKLIYEPL